MWKAPVSRTKAGERGRSGGRLGRLHAQGPAQLVRVLHHEAAQGAGGVLPMLIPVIGFPAGVLMGLGRMAARPLVDVVTPGAEDPAAA